MQPLADIVLKMDKNGSNVQLKAVTPAEVMFLCAIHRNNAGGDPIQKLKVIPPEEEKKQIEALRKQITELEKKANALDEDQTISSMEIKDRRLISYNDRISRLQSTIDQIEAQSAVRSLSPAAERNRLIGKGYLPRDIKAFYPGGSPALPADFDSARRDGVTVEFSTDSPGFIVGQAA